MANDGANATGVQIDGGPNGGVNVVGGGGLSVDTGNVAIKSGSVDIQNGSLSVDGGDLSVSNDSVDIGSFGVVVHNGSVNVANGGLSLNGNLQVNGNVNALSVFASNINQSSDRNLKEKFTAINPTEILDRVVAMPITSWNFKQDASERHIGPMAQDFYAAFNVGPDNTHIAVVDEGGVALAAIQGLNQKLQENQAVLQQKDAEIKALEKRMADLEALVKTSSHP